MPCATSRKRIGLNDVRRGLWAHQRRERRDAFHRNRGRRSPRRPRAAGKLIEGRRDETAGISVTFTASDGKAVRLVVRRPTNQQT